MSTDVFLLMPIYPMCPEAYYKYSNHGNQITGIVTRLFTRLSCSFTTVTVQNMHILDLMSFPCLVFSDIRS